LWVRGCTGAGSVLQPTNLPGPGMKSRFAARGRLTEALKTAEITDSDILGELLNYPEFYNHFCKITFPACPIFLIPFVINLINIH